MEGVVKEVVVSSRCTEGFSGEEGALIKSSERIFAVSADGIDVGCEDGLVGHFIGNPSSRTGQADVKVDVKSSVEVVGSDLSNIVFAGNKCVLVADGVGKGMCPD